MAKKRRWITVLVLILVSIGGILVSEAIKEYNGYSNIIQANWKIELPEEYEEVYVCDSGESFLGDGERYHVFQYEENKDIDKALDWKENKNIGIESAVTEILLNLNIDTMYAPNFEEKYKYYFQKDDTDFSKLYIIFSKKENRIYIAETIL